MHLEPSHANARRLFERDIEGPVTTLNLLRLREDCPCSRRAIYLGEEENAGTT